MNKSDSKNERPKEPRRFNQQQYDMLKRCSDKKDMAEWNDWREKNPNEEILLEGACLKEAYLEGANLTNARFCPEYSKMGHGRFEFYQDHKGKFANLEKANLKKARLQNATLNGANLNEAHMTEICLQRAKLVYAKLEKAILLRANLQASVLEGSNIKGAEISRAKLQRANFRTAIVDESTEIWKPQITQSRKAWDPEPFSNETMIYTGKRDYTDFQGVALELVRTDPKTKQLLEYNIRRSNWENWYRYVDLYAEKVELRERSPWLKFCLLFIRFFWALSDYGRSTGRIVLAFFWLSLFFAALYSNLAYWYPVGIVSNLEAEPHLPIWHYFLLLLLRPIYFSIVTMTTLGFGDMYANAQSICGHILLSVQVILGYVLLGALVTRFAVLFTAGGPAGKFADEK